MTTFCSKSQKILRSRPAKADGLQKKKATSPVDSETIAAVITPAGQGGIGAIRIAGPLSRPLLERLFRPSHSSEIKPFLMRHGQLVSTGGRVIDEVLSVFMPSGRSYTGLDQVEIYCHGGHQVIRTILDVIVESGARPAEPGEFTKLAFLNGRIDLARAEAVAELIAASTEAAYEAGREHLVGEYSEYVDSLRDQLVSLLAEIEASIDFTDEEIGSLEPGRLTGTVDNIADRIAQLAATYQGGRIIREGYLVVIWGWPNAGKSSLFNALIKQERALVDQEAGTTRDYLSEWIDLDGYAVNLIDTAGPRGEASVMEKTGQARSRELAAKADLVLWLADTSVSDWQQALAEARAILGDGRNILIGNKIDLVSDLGLGGPGQICFISCLTGEGLNKLRELIVASINEGTRDLTPGRIVTSARHRTCLDLAGQALRQVKVAAEAGESPEIIAFELRRAIEPLAEITGQIYTEEILEEIFSRFCIGK